MLRYLLIALLLMAPAFAQEPSKQDKLNDEVARMIGRLQIENASLKLIAEEKIQELLRICGDPCKEVTQ